MKGCRSFCRHIDPDNIRFACRKVRFDLFFAQRQTVFIINTNLCPAFRDSRPQTVQTLLVTEAIIGVSLLNQLLCIFQVETAFISFTLHIRPISAILVRSFIVNQARLFKRPVNNFQSAVHKTLLVCIFNTKHEISAFVFCNQVGIQRRTKIADMHSPCRTWCKSGSYFTHSFLSCFPYLSFLSFPVILIISIIAMLTTNSSIIP